MLSQRLLVRDPTGRRSSHPKDNELLDLPRGCVGRFPHGFDLGARAACEQARRQCRGKESHGSRISELSDLRADRLAYAFREAQTHTKVSWTPVPRVRKPSTGTGGGRSVDRVRDQGPAKVRAAG